MAGYSKVRDELIPLYPGWSELPPVAVFAAYLDESVSRQRGIFALAGYVGRVEAFDQWLSPKWEFVRANAPHPVKEFKASACNGGFGEFKNWTPQQRVSFRGLLVSVISNSRPLFGVGAAVRADWNGASTDLLRKKLYRAAYLTCFTLVMSDVLKLVRHQLGPDGHFQLICDEEKHMENKAKEMYKTLKELWTADQEDQIRTPHFLPSHKFPPLQAADLFAFETLRAMANRLENFPRKPRQTLRRLLKGGVHVAQYTDMAAWLRKDWPRVSDDPVSDVRFPLLFDSRPLHLPGFKRE